MSTAATFRCNACGFAETSDYPAFVEYMRLHGRKPLRPNRALTARPWRLTMTRKLFQPEPLGIGDLVEFEIAFGERLIGQVWARHPSPHTLWVVVDGHAYIVDERSAMSLDKRETS